MTLTNTIAVLVFATSVDELILEIFCGDASIKMKYPFSLVANAMLRKIERSAETVNTFSNTGLSSSSRRASRTHPLA